MVSDCLCGIACGDLWWFAVALRLVVISTFIAISVVRGGCSKKRGAEKGTPALLFQGKEVKPHLEN